MTDAGSARSKSEVRQSLEAMFATLLGESWNESGYALGEIGYGDAVEVTLHKDAVPFVVWLRPLGSPSASYKQTALLKIGYGADPPDDAGYRVLDAVHARLQEWERVETNGSVDSLFDGHAIDGPNLEMLAVRAGLKPALRYVVHPTAADDVARNMRSEGLHAIVTHAPAFVRRFSWWTPGETTIVHVGRTEQAARTAADLERAMMAGWRSWLRGRAIERALGVALGYPPCCTDTFLKIRSLPPDTIRFQALARTAGPAAAALNDIDDAQAVVSHLVCRYDCDPSRRYAEALLAELGRINSTARETRQRLLQSLVVRFRDGGGLRLIVQTPPDGVRHRLERIAGFGGSPLLAAWQEAFAKADAVEIGEGEVRILHGDRERGRLPAPPGDVQIRRFA